MTSRQSEFLVESSAAGESGRLAVIGRCGDGPVAVGTSFNFLYRYRPRAYPRGLEVPAEVEDVIARPARVEAIRAYGKELTELPAGWTGMLVLDADPHELVPKGWILGSHDPRETTDDASVAASRTGGK